MTQIGNNTTIETVSGLLVDLARPNPSDFKVTDIAWALSREPRFGGHTITALPYTVGQHSIQVANALRDGTNPKHALRTVLLEFFKDDEEVLMWLENISPLMRWKLMKLGLLHDASEAYLRDLPSPVKALPGLREAYLSAEGRIMNAILDPAALDCRIPTVGDTEIAWKVVHWADLYTRTIEAYHFMPSRASFWPPSAKISNLGLIDLQNFELPKPSIEIYEEFLGYFDELSR